ncbi:hypothetical protein SARC_12947, partial [Sphaeroforma arctica JP610]
AAVVIGSASTTNRSRTTDDAVTKLGTKRTGFGTTGVGVFARGSVGVLGNGGETCDVATGVKMVVTGESHHFRVDVVNSEIVDVAFENLRTEEVIFIAMTV